MPIVDNDASGEWPRSNFWTIYRLRGQLRWHWEVGLDNDPHGWKVGGWSRTPWGARRCVREHGGTF